jgi:hypothetical protein
VISLAALLSEPSSQPWHVIMKKFLLSVLALLPLIVSAQTITDGLMMPKKYFCTGFMYTHDKWTSYWEGDLKRENGNIGNVTTQTLMYVGNYGITDKINVIAMVPYVKTEASGGTLTGQEGMQDLSLAVKYNFFRKDYTNSSIRTFAVLNFSTPLSDYTPDLLPLSIGMASTNVSYRLNAFYKFAKMFYVNGSGAYTWRSNVTLDRPAYFTNGHQYNTEEVKMPNVFDYLFNIGILKNGLQAEISYTQQVTLGGDDIRRQDMPFVSNRMNASRLGGLVMYYLPKPKGLAVRGSYMTTISGRNVGESTTLLGGLLYTIQFSKSEN